MITPGMLLKRAMLLMLILVLAGCQAMTRERAKPGDPAFAPVEPEAMMADQPVNGSIYQNSRNHNLFGDSKALNVGDVVTVQLQENTAASKTSNTNITKESEAGLEAPSVLGQEGLGIGTDVSQDREFDGAAQADQSNQLSGSITVTVVEVMPNGVLRVRGEKWLELTQGKEYVRVSGLIRQQDIGSDNRVSSRRIADARISYGGTGDFDQSNRMGWLTRFFNSEWWPL
ncbi:flagellar basal body L-ring protein FlgH [Salicola sp. Rm-C-2C1-2]|uniref:flagellar basal body L-ring protein FlgH n=1 Tax=Salicola sp. Rm-C-2C1-2 TaxID=3141321 RepID=UPI0032E36C7C